MEEIELGDAFIVQTPPNAWHLYAIIASISDNSYLLVSITTSNTQVDPDKDCVINPGIDAPEFIVCQSTVAYSYARVVRENDIRKFVRSGEWQYNGRFSEEYVWQMQLKGACSKQIKHKYKTVLQKILDIQELYRMLG
jgi:hypothetical protein